MNSIFPCIKVNDIETTISWYCEFLKFQCTYKSSIKEPDSALIEKDELKIYIIKSEGREVYASNIIIIETSDIETEFEILENNGIIIIKDIGKGLFSEKGVCN